MKIRTIVTAALLTGIMSVNSFAGGINVFLDDNLISFPDAQPQIINERTMVPVRGLFEEMGFKIDWNDYSKIATLRGDKLIISAGEDLLMANRTGNMERVNISTEIMPVISDGRLYLPLRTISQITGKTVEWDANTKSVLISTPTEDEDGTPLTKEGKMTATAEEYLTTVFHDIAEIKKIVVSSNDPVLMRLYKLNPTGTQPNTAVYDSIYEYTHKLYDMEAPSGLNGVKASIDKFIETVEAACILGATSVEDSTYGSDEFYNKINELADQKYQISTAEFAVKLVEYFNANKVSFESIFSEYCLDVMN